MRPHRQFDRLLAGLIAATVASPLLAAEPMAIALTRKEAQWQVQYTLSQPAKELRFVRVDRQGNRASSWTAVDPAVKIMLEGGEEVVRRTDGKAFGSASFRMAPQYVSLEKDYAPFAPFGDGGLLIHTGRFHACAEKCNGEETFHLSLQPPAGAHAIVHGQVVASVDIEDRDDGTYLYVGQAQPVATPDVVAVIDQAFPADTRARLESQLPKLMAFYGREFGVLKDRPMLYLSNDEKHPGGGYGYQGGTLPGQVFAHRYGRNAAFSTPEFIARQDWFFGHEAAHLYQRYPALADEGDSWIHEGGADALAAVALQALGTIDREAVQARLRSSVESCANGIARAPLKRAHVDGSFDSFYNCGFVMQMAVDEAATRASKGACGLTCVWRDFQARVDAGEPWSTDTFIAAVRKRTDERTAAFLRAVANYTPARPAEMLREGLVRAGWNLGPAGVQ